MLDALLAAEELPEEYRDRCQVAQFFCSRFLLFRPLEYIYQFLLHRSSRIYCAMTVRGKADVDFTGYTTNAAPVGRTIPELSRLTLQIAPHQISWREHLCLFVAFFFLLCKYLLAGRKKEMSCRIVNIISFVAISVL
jgi:hypothetical protein